jgi:hypothetical protein
MCETTRDREPDELCVVVDDIRALEIRIGFEPDACGHDFECRKRDLDVDLHVMDRQRVGIDVDVQTGRFLVTYRSTDENEIIPLPKRTNPILPVVQHLERPAIVAQR